MVATLDEGDVEFDIRVQLQTDPHLMPIENNGVLWPEKLSPRVPVATLRIPRQNFDSPAQLDFAKRSRTTRGTDRRSIARSATRAAPAAACTRRSRSFATR